jgi:CspA family cold shock protein
VCADAGQKLRGPARTRAQRGLGVVVDGALGFVRRFLMLTGTITRLIVEKGFGFIRGDEARTEYFFYRSGVRDTMFALLVEGQRVEFTPEASTKGPRAAEVRPLAP